MSSLSSLRTMREQATEARKPGLADTADVLDAERKVHYLATEAAYDQWAAVYDSDGNFLQAIDDRELETLLPDFLLSSGLGPSEDERNGDDDAVSTAKTVIDLGCGTGRNTAKLAALLASSSPSSAQVSIIGLDSSQEMLRVAEQKLAKLLAARNGTSTSTSTSDANIPPVRFQRFDINASDQLNLPPADALISTLVLEHIALDVFFASAARLLRPGARLLVTNMHHDMGVISQAGFVDPGTGDKIRPAASYAHSVADAVEQAARCGFELLSRRECAVDGADVPLLGRRSAKWVGVKCWFGLVFRLTEGRAGGPGV